MVPAVNEKASLQLFSSTGIDVPDYIVESSIRFFESLLYDLSALDPRPACIDAVEKIFFRLCLRRYVENNL